MILFRDFVPGALLGRHEEVLTDTLLAEWQAAFPCAAPSAHLSPGLAMVLLIRAYMNILPERPPGTVHARQRLRVHRPVRAGEQIVTLLFCDRAEVRNKRRWVYMRAQACGADGAPLCDGEMLMLWAR